MQFKSSCGSFFITLKFHNKDAIRKKKKKEEILSCFSFFK